MTATDYVELHARSAFSFLRGAAFPEHLAERAAALGLSALALCDRDGVYGAPRFYGSAREAGLKPIVGCELTLDDGSVLPVLVSSRTGYQNLCRLITRAKLRGTKTEAPVCRDELAEFAEGLVALTGDEEGPLRRCLVRGDRPGAEAALAQLCAIFGKANVFVEVQRHLQRGEELVNGALIDLARAHRQPLLATNGALYATRRQRAVLDVFTCARLHTHLDAAGRLLSGNAERCLKPARHMARLFHDLPEAITNTVRLAERLEFSLEKLGYEFPRYPVPEGESMDACLRKATMAGALHRYRELNEKVRAQLERELALIAQLGFSGYFLIVWDIVNFCREQGIMVQGRGSAANSAVCYSLGITACDPIHYRLLFERFLAEGRTSWPDIDLDLPSGERRERVIQEVYRRYGPRGAAMTANVISFRGRSAMREIGKALNFPPEVLGRFSALYGGGDFPHTLELAEQLEKSGLALTHPRAPAAIELYQQIHGLPRHLGQHSGGMIICQGQLDSVMPLENASMPGRVVAQWDKDDCEDLGIIKVDLLGLGMMSVMQDCIELCAAKGGPRNMAEIPADDPAVYEALRRADTIGAFQVESRAQQATLPRLKPERFYDLVVEVAIVRPGPIQGGLMHPYLARRSGREPISYIHEDVRDVLERTLGVPLFQEQMLKMAMVLAGFSGAEAEELRRALSFHRSHERMNRVCAKLRERMRQKGHTTGVIDQVVKSVQSFAVYGFPESHAISFALIAYASMWLKVHCAPEFFASILNNQPMGFYSSASLIKDGQRHGVRFRPVSVRESEWSCTVEPDGRVRLGLCTLKGLQREHGEGIVAARREGEFTSLDDFRLRTALTQAELRRLAESGALHGLTEHRRAALWQVEEPCDTGDLFSDPTAHNTALSPLAPMTREERVQADYRSTDLSLGPHPMALLRAQLPHIWRAADLAKAPNGTLVQIAGNVICRQRPGTANGFVFISLEDETGIANAIITPQLFERRRLSISEEAFLQITGIVQNHENVIHVRACHIEALTTQTAPATRSHDFR